MSKAQELVFELLRISTSAQQTLSHTYDDKDWEEALDIANEQAIVGVLTVAMEALTDKSVLPSKLVLLQWIGNAQIVEQALFLCVVEQRLLRNIHRTLCHINTPPAF